MSDRYSGYRLSEMQEPYPKRLPVSDEEAYNVSRPSAYRYIKNYPV